MSLTPEQVAFRKTGIGASESAALFGVHPYLSALELYARKIGLAEALPQPKNPARLWWGSKAEALILDRYEIETGRTLLRTPEALHCWRSDNADCIISNLDGATEDFDHLVECKTAASRSWWNDWDNGKRVPIYIQIQCQHQMLVTGARTVDVAALADFELYITTIERDSDFIAKLRAKIIAFWHGHVLAKVPPMWDGSDSCYEAAKVLYPASEGEGGIASKPELQAAALEYRELGEVKSTTEARRKAIKNQIICELGDYRTADLGDGFILTRQKNNAIKIKECQP